MNPATITDVTVHTGGRWLPGRDVHLAGGRITAISEHGELPHAGEVLDGRGGHLTPGLVNTHTHLFQAGLRGIGEGLGLLAWLGAVGEEAALLTPERAYATAAAAVLSSGLARTASGHDPRANRVESVNATTSRWLSISTRSGEPLPLKSPTPPPSRPPTLVPMSRRLMKQLT